MIFHISSYVYVYMYASEWDVASNLAAESSTSQYIAYWVLPIQTHTLICLRRSQTLSNLLNSKKFPLYAEKLFFIKVENLQFFARGGGNSASMMSQIYLKKLFSLFMYERYFNLLTNQWTVLPRLFVLLLNFYYEKKLRSE